MTTTQDLRMLAKVFTRPVFANLARTGNPHPVLDILAKHALISKNPLRPATLASAFEDGWEILAAGYRNEYVYKNELATRLVFKRHSPRTASFQVELGVGSSIVDVAIANGTSTAYEIKTEFDSSKRLKSQTADYLRVFDKVYVVTHPNHVERYERELDPKVGLIVLSPKHALSPLREARSNIENVEPRAVFRCLRRAEYLSATKELFGESPTLPNGVIAAYCEKLFLNLSPEEAHRVFVKALRARTTDKSTVDFISLLPPSLRALGYATPLSNRQRGTLTDLLSCPLGT
ncbi:hypothetical protein BZG29_07625 [Janthinobacterium sp. LM6]|nr:hypothetical protein BZG29_07625 [Janthinobacterium sp. LM6]